MVCFVLFCSLGTETASLIIATFVECLLCVWHNYIIFFNVHRDIFGITNIF